jgi:hypothetical protein
MGMRFTRNLLAGFLLTFVMAVAGYGAAGGSSSVSVAAAAGIDITVPAAASIASTPPGNCNSSGTNTVNVKSNKGWNLQVRSDPVNYPNGKAKNGTTEMYNAFQYKGADVASFTNITSTYATLYGSTQPKTAGAGVDVSMTYQQCVDYSDSPATYTIVVDYLGIQP